jgi:phage terminase Nu1 subunit (DNA packaging protein)
MAQTRKSKQKQATREEFARIMEISPTAVTHLVSKGVLTRGAPVGQWLVEYGRHMAKVAAGWQSQNGEVDRMLEAALLDRSKREEIEMRIAEKRGVLIPDEVFIDGVSETFNAVKTRLLSIPNRLRARRPHLTIEDIAAFEDEIQATLTELSDDRFPRSIRERLAQERGRVSASAKTNGQPMGGPQAKT